jgi:hypothetical protein
METNGPDEINLKATLPKMPLGLRLLSWLLTLDAVAVTAYVWYLIVLVMTHGKYIDMFQAHVFFPLLIGYHLLLLLWTLLGNVMQSAWRSTGSVSLFPVAFTVSALFLDIAALEIVYLVSGPHS